MKKYHVYVYQVSGMIELNLKAENAEIARGKALQRIEENHYSIKFSDNKQVAIAFEIED